VARELSSQQAPSRTACDQRLTRALSAARFLFNASMSFFRAPSYALRASVSAMMDSQARQG